MPLTIDITKLPSSLKSVLLKEFQIESKKDASYDQDLLENEPHEITLSDNDNVDRVKRKLKDIFIKNRVRDFVVTLDNNDKSNIIFLERSHVEKSGIYNCIHCGMEFESEVHLSVHHKIHYFL
ncbi:MAG TPA: hypothetical protein VF884_12340 [Nitrososphaeraceae archaeon]